LLSHQTIHARFYEVDLPSKKIIGEKNKFILVTKKQLRKLAIPKLIENFIEKKIE